MRKTTLAGLAGLLIHLTPQLAISQPGTALTSRTVPRLPDGTISFGPAPGETGHWDTGQGGVLMEHDVELRGNVLADPADADDVAPFKPWSRELFLARQANLGVDDPHPRCSGNGGPRTFDTPYGVDFVQDSARQRVLILIGWSRRWREIYMDGRQHPDPETYTPTFFGHSIGHWEDDTLVIDTAGFNEKFWFARRPTGIVHTESLHLIERISRPSYETLRYEVTVDDPEAYTRPWTASWEVPWTDFEIVEYLCTENNRDPAHFVGPQ